MKKSLNFKDILIILVVATVFSFLYKLVWIPYRLLEPIGAQVQQLIYGVWFIAGPLAMLLVRKPGAALLGEMGAALIEVFLAGGIGIQSFVFGGFQGLATEAAYALFGYTKFNLGVTLLAAILTCITSLLIDSFYGYLALETWALYLAIGFRFTGAILIAAILPHSLLRILDQAGVTQLANSSQGQNP